MVGVALEGTVEGAVGTAAAARTVAVNCWSRGELLETQKFRLPGRRLNHSSAGSGRGPISSIHQQLKKLDTGLRRYDRHI